MGGSQVKLQIRVSHCNRASEKSRFTGPRHGFPPVRPRSRLVTAQAPLVRVLREKVMEPVKKFARQMLESAVLQRFAPDI